MAFTLLALITAGLLVTAGCTSSRFELGAER
jgi:hypothetical protein